MSIGRAAAYARISNDLQKYAIENQLVAIEAFCIASRLSLVRRFIDEGKSGLSLKGRRGLEDLLTLVRSGEADFDTVVAFDVSRFGRFQDIDEAAFHEQELRRAGVRVLYCADPHDNEGTPVAMIMKALRRAMAAEFSRDLSRRVARGKRRAAEKGRWSGGSPGFGYRRAIVGEGGRLIRIAKPGERKAVANHQSVLTLGPPDEVAAIRRLFRLFLEEGKTIAEILRALNGDGGTKPEGGWTRHRVTQILSSEKYAGVLRFGATSQYLRSARIRRPRETWVVVKDAHPAIVPLKWVRAARAKLSEPKNYAREAVVLGLRQLLERNGAITQRLIQQEPSLPSMPTLRRMFGSLAQARSEVEAMGSPSP